MLQLSTAVLTSLTNFTRERSHCFAEPTATDSVDQAVQWHFGPLYVSVASEGDNSGGGGGGGEGAGGGHPSRRARGHGGALSAPTSGSGAEPLKPTLFAFKKTPKTTQKRGGHARGLGLYHTYTCINTVGYVY